MHTTVLILVRRRSKLSLEEHAKISALHKAGFSYCAISGYLKRSQNVIRAYRSASILYSGILRQSRRKIRSKTKGVCLGPLPARPKVQKRCKMSLSFQSTPVVHELIFLGMQRFYLNCHCKTFLLQNCIRKR